MYLIVGLGNPGEKYAGTRHNVGFDAVDALAETYDIRLSHKRARALWGRGEMAGVPVILAKPQTYMNLSGEAVSRLVRMNGLDPAHDLIVLSDDIHLAPGNLRIRQQGSAGGHNGLKDIIAHLGTDAFLRVRIGVGEPPAEGEQVQHVLSRFSKSDRERVDAAIADAAEAVAMIVRGDTEAAMGRYNQKKY